MTCCCGRVQPNPPLLRVSMLVTSDHLRGSSEFRYLIKWHAAAEEGGGVVRACVRARVVFCWRITRVVLICDVSQKAVLRVNAHAASYPMLCESCSRACVRVRACKGAFLLGASGSPPEGRWCTC